ncbi:MAG TPA: Pycsar system effector family protein [Parafilimonas sp.]|nr:Pycsar system effector family protein [Parafilimonas sp.]
MDYNLIYKKAEGYVTGLFEKFQNEKLVFHNLQHTRTVVERTKEIAAHYSLSERDMLVLYVASWFHDTGHLYTPGLKNHEEKSVDVMRKFMADYASDTELISEIEACIMSTKMPRNPASLIQHILCDADTYHFGTKEFKDTNKRMREEYQLREERVDKKVWDENTLQMLNTHQFYTSYCKDLLDEKKKDNIRKLKKKTKEYEKEKDDLKINEASAFATKGIQTMLRLTSENHLKLSDMADHKANILISVNAIIISVILGVLMRKLDEAPNLTIPTIIFLAVAVTTIVISILATRPKISGGTFSEQDVIDKKTNLLFFGNFYKAPYEQYDTAMRKMMKDPDYLYGSLVKDIYFLAVVLGRKYRLIRIAYYIFMVGIIVSVVAFAIASLFFGMGTATSSSSSAMPL